MSKLSFIKKTLKLHIKIWKQYLKALKYHKFPCYGITRQKRDKKIVISLTTYKERIKEVHLTINTLLYQSIKPDEIILWLSEEEFKNKTDDLPKSLTGLQKYGLSIKFCTKDIKSYKKIIPTILEFPDDIIVLADDDLYYQKDWLELLYKSYLKNPDMIHCHRAHKVRFSDNDEILPYENWEKCIKEQVDNEIYLATSGPGILLPHPGRNLFHKDITNENLFLTLAPKGDDLWIWAMAVLNNTDMKIVENNIVELLYINPKREYGISSGTTLYHTNSKGGNDRQLSAIFQHYPDIKNIMLAKRKKRCQKSA